MDKSGIYFLRYDSTGAKWSVNNKGYLLKNNRPFLVKYATNHWIAVFCISILILPQPTLTYCMFFYYLFLLFIILPWWYYTSLYIFQFIGAFLPALENARKFYKQAQYDNQKICRKKQLPNLSLYLVFYVLDKLCNEGKLQPNDRYAALLTES